MITLSVISSALILMFISFVVGYYQGFKAGAQIRAQDYLAEDEYFREHPDTEDYFSQRRLVGGA